MTEESFLTRLKPYEQKLYHRLKQKYQEHAEELSKQLGFKITVNHPFIVSIIKNIERYGKPFCPCRREHTPETICPCKYHVEELRKYGTCLCGLFKREGMTKQEYLEQYRKIMEEEYGD